MTIGFQLVDYVTLESVGRVKVSTAQMPGGIHGDGYEIAAPSTGPSCLDTAQDNVYWLAANLAAPWSHRPALPSRR